MTLSHAAQDAGKVFRYFDAMLEIDPAERGNLTVRTRGGGVVQRRKVVWKGEGAGVLEKVIVPYRVLAVKKKVV